MLWLGAAAAGFFTGEICLVGGTGLVFGGVTAVLGAVMADGGTDALVGGVLGGLVGSLSVIILLSDCSLALCSAAAFAALAALMAESLAA